MSTLVPGSPFVTKLSSAGLVYLHYGEEVIRSKMPSESSNDLIKTIYNKIYKKFIEAVDAIDNGISVCSETPR